MMHNLVVTTKKDFSLPYLRDESVRIAYFDGPIEALSVIVTNTRFDAVYLRDPFNTGTYAMDDLEEKIRLVRETQPTAHYIDHVTTLDDMLIEDKWRQYRLFSAWMPRTVLGGTRDAAGYETIAKKRISSRSKHILFGVRPDELSEEWIVQERLLITEELRVYYVFGRIVATAGVRQSKSDRSKTKLIGTRRLNRAEEDFCLTVCRVLPGLDFAGVDIALTPEGLRLLEINRSPQFEAYTIRTGNNMADRFWQRAREHKGY